MGLADCWLFTVSEENWATVRTVNLFGAPDVAKGRRVYELVKPGDVLVFYVAKKGSRNLGGMIVGVYRTASAWFRDEKPLWPDEVREGRMKYPWRVRVEPVKLGTVSFTELIPKLSFIGNKDRANAYLVGTPANLRRPIPEEDLKIILEALG
jgi:predicted RNA-binding protein